MKQVPKKPTANVRLRLLLIAAAFAAPMLAAYVLYYSGWRPESVHPHGELVTPAHPITDAELAVMNDGTLRFSSLRRHWLLVYFGSSDCTAVCEQALYKMRQVIAAQNREAHRARAVMVLTDARALDRLRDPLKGYPEMMVLTGPPASISGLAREFEVAAGSALAGLHRIYVVDPLGNLMMSYPADADASGMRKDLTRLLRLSQIG